MPPKPRTPAPPSRRKSIEGSRSPAIKSPAKSPVAKAAVQPQKPRVLTEQASFSGAKMASAASKGSIRDVHTSLSREHEALRARHEALQHEHASLLLKHEESVRSCRLLIEQLKERQPQQLEPDDEDSFCARAMWRQPPVQSWPPEPELSIECPPAEEEYDPHDGVGSEEEDDDDDEGRPDGLDEFDHGESEGEGEEGLSPPEAMRLLERLMAQEQLIAELQAQVGRLTAELVRKVERDDAIVIHVSPPMW